MAIKPLSVRTNLILSAIGTIIWIAFASIYFFVHDRPVVGAVGLVVSFLNGMATLGHWRSYRRGSPD